MGVAIDILADAVQAQKSDVMIDRPALVQEFAGWHFHKMIPEMERRHGVSLDHMALDDLKRPATLDALLRVQVCPGIVSRLEALAESGRQCGLVTSSEFERVNLCLNTTDIARFFPEERKFSANDTLPSPLHKPDPTIYNFALKALGLTADEAIAVEDSKSGVAAGVAAGIPVIGYTGASHIPEVGKVDAARVLLAQGAAVVIGHLDDLEAAVQLIENPDAEANFTHPVFFQDKKASVVVEKQSYPLKAQPA
jgi:beta-phosphoglucomutase-like phosphatase (HAD superfamily)